MDKLKMHSPNLTDENIAKIREMFPGCVTEAAGDDGKIRLAVDFDQLRQELSDHIVEGPQERYRLDWPGKRAALLAANAPIGKTLRPARDESVNFDATKNLFIEGDNLEALKLLQESYLGAIKLIYIDPPYNTGNDFIYRDTFASSVGQFLEATSQVDSSGMPLVANKESNGRFHSDWLSMIYPRLRVAKNLLKEGGIILVSVDDGEMHNLRKMCDEIFGAEAFVAQFVWRARQFTDARAKTNVSTDHEYILAYARTGETSLRGVKRDESKFSNPDKDPRGDWMSRSILGLATEDQRPNLHYDIVEPGTGRSFPPNPSTGWRYGKERMADLIADGRILFPKNDSGRPREKKFRNEMQSELISFRSVIDGIYTADGTQDIRDLFGVDLFPFPKPVKLLEQLIEQVADEDGDIILDFFGGSATTAHAVFRRNASDGINRSFIMVQLPEAVEPSSPAGKSGFSTIGEVGKERMRRAGARVLKGDCSPIWNKDIGFRVLKVDTSNMKDIYYAPDQTEQKGLLDAVDNVKPDRCAEDLLFQVLVDWGVDLTLPIRRENVQGKTVLFVDENALVACFDTGVTGDLVKELAKHEPLRVVFRDTGFVSDALKINVTQIFRQLSPTTEVKAI